MNRIPTNTNSSQRIAGFVCCAAAIALCVSCSDGTGGPPATGSSAAAPVVIVVDGPGSTPVGSKPGTPLPVASGDAGISTGAISTVPTSTSGIDLSKLPVPAGVKSIYADANTAMYLAATAVEPTEKEVARLLAAEGWLPYGTVIGSQYFKRDLVLVNASIGATESQAGKTMITYHAEKITVDLPALADAEGLRYTDSTKQVFYDTKSDMATVEKFHRDVLGKSEWKATTEKPFKIDFKDELIFRNPKKDMLTLQMHEFEGKRRVTLTHMSAAQVAEQEARFQAELAQKKKDAEKPLPKVTLTPPADAKIGEQKKNRLKLEVATGKAKGVVEAWRKTLTADGWQEDDVRLDDKVGGIAFRKEKQYLSVDYIDPGFIAGEITVTATGVELSQ